MSDERGPQDDPERDPVQPPAELKLPSYESLARFNTLIRLIDRQRIEHATPPTELTQVDRQPLLDAGFTPEEIESAVRDQHMWERLALKDHGRIGRDPERIAPFLERFGEAWKEHAGMRFTELVTAVTLLPPGLNLSGVEEPVFLQQLEAWASANAPGSTSPDRADEDRSRWIDSFLARFLQRWAVTPDTRFGQMVANLGGLLRSREGLTEVTDPEFLELLGAAPRIP